MEPLKILSTGYVTNEAGSIAGANAVLIRELLARGHEMTFLSKRSFVDPRLVVAGCPGAERLTFMDCTNRLPDKLRRTLVSNRNSFLGRSLGAFDSSTYRRLVAKSMRAESNQGNYDVALWLGTWAAGKIPGIPTISFVQGAPGTDARSIQPHRKLIERLAGCAHYLKLLAFARWRLGPGLPPFAKTDHVITGSSWSRQCLHEIFGLPLERLHSLPYAIDLDLFQPPKKPRNTVGPLRVLWLGRFVPRKRLDVFLEGAALAIQRGVDIQLHVVGRSTIVPGFEKLLQEFPYQERLICKSHVPRKEIGALFHQCDVLAQPSDDEDFGSSIAEAQACGIPAIVGKTNGTGDYVCPRSIRLADDKCETFADTLFQMSEMKQAGDLADAEPSRSTAVNWFSPKAVTNRLEVILGNILNKKSREVALV